MTTMHGHPDVPPDDAPPPDAHPAGPELPRDLDAEQAVLSLAMADIHALDALRATLAASDFFHPHHATIYSAMLAMRDTGEAIDPLTLADQLRRDGTLDRVGGKDALLYLIGVAEWGTPIETYAAIVREASERRGLIALAERMTRAAYQGKQPARALAQIASASLGKAALGAGDKGFKPARSFTHDVLLGIEARQNGTAPAGVRTGLTKIDTEIGGFRGGEFIIIAGVPSSGKTALALQILLNAAQNGDECCMVSAEMASKGLIERTLGNLAGVASGNLRKGLVTNEEWHALVRASGTLSRLDLHIDDAALPEIDQVLARLRGLKATRPALKLAVVDFIQLIRSASETMMALALTQISYALKGVAKELDIAVIATCQVDAKEVERRGGKDDSDAEKRPYLHDLRWSQGMREAADFVACVYRPAMYSEGGLDASAGPSTMRVYFDKCRDLPPFTAYLAWHGPYMRVEDMPGTVPLPPVRLVA